MASTLLQLAAIYLKLCLGIGSGWVIGQFVPKTFANVLGKWLFWIGVPISVFGFVRQIELSGAIWLAPVVAWLAMMLCAALAWLWLRFRTKGLSKATQGSFLLVSSIGNTGYLGYPITLAIAGEQFFAWALFYDLLGSLIWGYGIGVMAAAYFADKQSTQVVKKMLIQVAINPALWSLVIGLSLRSVRFPRLVEDSLQAIAWGVIIFAIVLIGMRLSQLQISQQVPQIQSSLAIKMAVVPLLFGLILPWLGVEGLARLTVVLQIAMPPAFSTLIVAEAYQLDRELAVSSLATGCCVLLFALPIWLLLFS